MSAPPSNPVPETEEELLRRAVTAIERIAEALQSIAVELHVANGLRASDFP